ncbi:MAG: hypothetical protein WD926_01685 [Patescibacteria group bacterium]
MLRRNTDLLLVSAVLLVIAIVIALFVPLPFVGDSFLLKLAVVAGAFVVLANLEFFEGLFFVGLPAGACLAFMLANPEAQQWPFSDAAFLVNWLVNSVLTYVGLAVLWLWASMGEGLPPRP